MSSSQDIRVVIIEDDPMVQRINEEFLNRISGFECAGVFGSVEASKAFLTDNQVDLVLLDVFMPDGSGVNLLKWIREEGLELDVILITADKSGKTARQVRRYGAVDYLVKPFRFERFEESLNHYRREIYEQEIDQDLDQSSIDHIMNIQREQPKESPKNLTQESIYKFLREHSGEGFTASAVAETLGISRITARRYLDELETKNLVRMELSYGGVGRPQNLYYII